MIQNRVIRTKIDSGDGALDLDITPTSQRSMQLLEARLTTNEAVTAEEDLTLKVDRTAPELDSVLHVEDLQGCGGSDGVISIRVPFCIMSGETLNIAWPNTDDKTYLMEVFYLEEFCSGKQRG